MKERKSVPLAQGEYALVGGAGATSQTAAARREFMEAVRRVLPQFFEELCKQVYPSYARLARKKADYWQPGGTFSTWQHVADRHRQLTPFLLDWARTFHCEDETWILEGALQTLWLWQRYVRFRFAC